MRCFEAAFCWHLKIVVSAFALYVRLARLCSFLLPNIAPVDYGVGECPLHDGHLLFSEHHHNGVMNSRYSLFPIYSLSEAHTLSVGAPQTLIIFF